MRINRLFTVIFFYTIIVMLVSGCGYNTDTSKTKAPASQKIEITDSLGRNIILSHVSQRAVVENAYNAEIINAIGAIDKIVGVDYYIYQDKEGFKNRFTKDMMIGHSKGEINYEKIVDLKPDVIIMTSNCAWQEAENKLKPFDIRVIVVDAYYTCKFAENVRLMGKIFGKEEQAEEFSNYFMSKVKYVNERLKGVSPKTVYFEYRNKGRTTVPGDYFYDMVRIAHGKNIFENAKNPNIDIETVVQRNPQYIVKVSEPNVNSSYIPPKGEDMQRILKELITRPSWEYTDAVKKNRIFLMSHYVHGGASKIVGAMYIAKFLYPEELPGLNPEELFKIWVTKYQHLEYKPGHTYPRYRLED